MSEKFDEYWRLLDLWKFYLDLIIRANIFFTAIASGVLAYVIADVVYISISRFALLPVFVLTVGFLIISYFGIFQSAELASSLIKLANESRIHQPVHAYLLRNAMILTAVLYLLICIGIILIFFFYDNFIPNQIKNI